MQGRLTDQAVVAVALARTAAGGHEATVAHLIAGLAVEPEGRAGRRLRERATAAAALHERAAATPAAPLELAVAAATRHAGQRAASTVDLLDAAISTGGADVAAVLDAAGYQRDLDGWLTTDLDDEWFEDAETFGFHPSGDETFDGPASRVVAQVRAIDGGAVHVLIAAAAAPDGGVRAPDPRDLAAGAAKLRGANDRWDAGLDAVIRAAATLREGPAVTVHDLVRAALVAGGDGPRLVLELAGDPT